MGDPTKGLIHKFDVTRTDGTSAPGQKHDGCDYFVLDLTHDPHALPALMSYTESCRETFPLLARDLDAKVKAMAYRIAATPEPPPDRADENADRILRDMAFYRQVFLDAGWRPPPAPEPDVCEGGCGHVFTDEEVARVTDDDVRFCEACYDDLVKAIESETCQKCRKVHGSAPCPGIYKGGTC